METKRNVFLWTLYDFANSIISITFFLYFAQWIVIDRGFTDLSFNLTLTAAAVLLLLTAPISGVLLDRSLRRITGLRYATCTTALLYGLCGFFAVSNNEIAALVFFTLGLYMYLLSFTFYTPLLHDIAPAHRRGRVSGLGIAANYAGQFLGLLVALPFATGKLSLFGGAPRAETLLPAVFLFLIFSLPMLLLFREPKRTAERLSFPSTIHQAFIQTKKLLSYSSVGFFLLAYFLFNDAIKTAANNFPLFLEQVWHVSDTTKTYILLGILITSGLGGLVGGIIADRIGHKKTLTIILSVWVILLPVVALLTNFILFVIAATLMGIWLGATWTVCRAVMAGIAPKGSHNLAFAYYGVAERASSLVGPVVWGLIVTNLISMGSVRYRIAVLAVTGFIILGIIALSWVKEKGKETPPVSQSKPEKLRK